MLQHINNCFSILESNSAQDKQSVWSSLVGHILAFTSACTGGLFSICRSKTEINPRELSSHYLKIRFERPTLDESGTTLALK